MNAILTSRQAAAYAAAAAGAAARRKILQTCADIVREHYTISDVRKMLAAAQKEEG